MDLPIGTCVRITDPYSFYHGRIAAIDGDTSFEVEAGERTPFVYTFVVLTYDNEDIQHGYVAPDGVVVLGEGEVWYP